MTSENSQYRFKHHPETCNPDDYWGQVKRTVGGQPLDADQIEMMVVAIKTGLELSPDDVLLDLCCGNGALTARIFEFCRGGLGVDYSDFLIDVAKRRFERRITERYRLADALDYVSTEDSGAEFTKVLCYGAFPYFSTEAAKRLLQGLSERFNGVTHVFLGQLPDRTRIRAFFSEQEPVAGEESDPSGVLGMWRSPAELADLARSAGWSARCEVMPATFYAAHYRFDAILTPLR